MEINDLLKRLVEVDGSDLYLATGAAPSAKVSGDLIKFSDKVYDRGEVAAIANSVMNEEQREEFDRELEMNLAISPAGVGRFRINIFKQRNEVSIVARNIQTEIPNLDKLGLPEILKDVITAKNGLVLFVGGTGSGKSTSLAALIDHRNSARGGHIITIEDPVEYVHAHKKCIVNQREVGVDTLTYSDALKNTLRQAPDVILIGEIRDRETMEHAVAFAETGHLAISTLHANNANQALDRIINFFPEERKAQLLHDLGNNIRAIVSQRLIPTVDGKRCAAIEILLGSHTIKQMIMKDQLSDIKEAMQKSENQGMKTFDSALYELAVEGRITQEEALKNADSANNLRLRFKLTASSSDEEDDAELLLRGQLPSKVAATSAATTEDSNSEADEKSTGKDSDGTNDDASASDASDTITERMSDVVAAVEAQMQNTTPQESQSATSSASASVEQPEAESPAGLHEIQAAIVAQIDAGKQGDAANTSSNSDVPEASKSSIDASMAAFELSLEEESIEDLEPPEENDAPEEPKFGMGKIG